MTRWSVRRLLWALPLVPLAATPAQACSITCYGSIVITSLGTDGIKIQCQDGGMDHPMPVDPPPGGGGGDGGVIKPPDVSIDPPPPDPMPPGIGAEGSPDPTVTENPTGTPPTDSVPPDEPPVDVPSEEPPPVVEVPPPVDTPPVDDIPPMETSAPPPGGGVAETPEPASLTLLGLAGLGGLGYARRRRS